MTPSNLMTYATTQCGQFADYYELSRLLELFTCRGSYAVTRQRVSAPES